MKITTKKKFEILAYSYGVNDGSPWRKRFEKASDRFVEIGELSDYQAAKKIYKDKVDILVDLKGHTYGHRLDIFGYRPALVQIGYLGYPGTTGSSFIDYIIADKIVVQKDEQKHYSERLIYLPNTYRPTDDGLKLEPLKKAFAQKGKLFGKNVFVLGSFNTNYKIEPELFEVWMRILNNTPNSILWMLESNKIAKSNLIKAAKKYGVGGKRLFFAGKLPKKEHLRRLRLVDLALDTSLVNGHTTTVDCLWAGVPVITLKGNHFASRVSASVLTALGMKELIVNSLREYQKLAIEIVSNNDKHGRTRTKLEKNKKTYPLFDTKGYTRNLEKIYMRTWREI